LEDGIGIDEIGRDGIETIDAVEGDEVFGPCISRGVYFFGDFGDDGDIAFKESVLIGNSKVSLSDFPDGFLDLLDLGRGQERD
jgi:hypothetical protein